MAEQKSGASLMSGVDLGITYGDRQVLKRINFRVLPGDHAGLIGANGQGKTTFLRICAGREKRFDGKLIVQPDLEIGYVEQEPQLDLDKTVLENVEQGVKPIKELLARFERIGEQLGEPEVYEDADRMQAMLDEQQRVQDRIEAKKGWEVDRRLEIAMQALRCPPPDALARHLSGGERRRVALCRVLMQHPDLLLLDEPTNHLDAWTIEWLESYLADYGGGGAYILVTHDRYFLDRVTKVIWELENGFGWGYEGNYSAYLEAKATQVRVREKEQSRRLSLYEKELEWIRSTPKARTAKAKHRVQEFDKLEAEVKAITARGGDLEINIPTGPPLSDLVLRAEGLKKGYGGRTLIDDLGFELPKGGIIGVTGPNGCGKTTLVKMLMGMEKPDAGTIKVGERTRFCYVDQGRETLDPTKTVFEEVSAGLEWVSIGAQKINIRSYLARFLLTGSVQQTKVGELSGGERNRVQLAKLLRGGGNVIVLDEPTNDLDLQTLRVLEESLVHFPGCAIVITHDRYFLDRIATHVLAFEGDGKVTWCEGSFETYRTVKKARDGDAGDKPEGGKGKHVKMVK